MDTAPQPPHRTTTLLVGALLLFLCIAACVNWLGMGVTIDEPGGLAAGLSYVRSGRIGINLQHPPLLKLLAGLSLQLGGIRWPDTPDARMAAQGTPKYEQAAGNDILSANGRERTMFWGRLPFAALSVLLGWLVYALGRRLVGAAAAIGGLFLYVLDPNILAHATLAGTDSGFATFVWLYLLALWHYLECPGPSRAALAGVALGAVLVAKFSAIALLPVTGLLLAAASFEAKFAARTALQHGRWFLMMLAVAAPVIYAAYLFPSNPLLYFDGLRLVNADHNPDYRFYFAGELGTHFSSYYAAAWLLKTPLPHVLLAGAGAVLLLRRGAASLRQRAFLAVPALVLFAGYTAYSDNIGIRYIIPVMPFLHLAGGVALAALLRRRRAAAVAACTWAVLAAAGAFPSQLPYFNEAACFPDHLSWIGRDGGTRCGPLWLDDSNVDWAQALPQLKTWADRNAPHRTLHLAAFSFYPPGQYGFAFQPATVAELLQPPTRGLYAISSHLVARLPALAAERFGGGGDWLRTAEPRARVGGSMYVFDFGDGP